MADWRREVTFHFEGSVNHLQLEANGEVVTIRVGSAESIFLAAGTIAVQRRTGDGGKIIGSIRIRDEQHSLIEGDEVVVLGKTDGTVRVSFPPGGPDAPEVREHSIVGVQVTKRRAKDEVRMRLEREEAEAREERLSQGNPTVLDIVERLDEIPAKPYTLAELIGAILRCRKAEAMHLVYTGDLPIYPFDPEPRRKKFDAALDKDVKKHAEALQMLGSRSQRIEYFEDLPSEMRQRMRLHFGRNSPDHRTRNANRDVWTAKLCDVMAYLRSPAYNGERNLKSHSRRCDMPQYVLAWLNDVPGEERRGRHWEVLERG